MAQINLNTPYQPRNPSTKVVLTAFAVQKDGSAEITVNLVDAGGAVVETITTHVPAGSSGLNYFNAQAPTILAFWQSVIGPIAAGPIT